MTWVEILTIGNELLQGHTCDTNSYWISTTLEEAGFRTLQKTTVGDDKDQILKAFAEAEQRANIVLITGGLGPTSDDLTKPCLATYFDCPIAIDQDALIAVEAFFKRRGKVLTETNRQQAALPVCCERIINTAGTASGMWFNKKGKVFISMPGVPGEMKKMMIEKIVPKLKNTFTTHASYTQTVNTIEIGESFLADKIALWEKNLPRHIRVAYLPKFGEVKLRLKGIGDNLEKIKSEVEECIKQLQPLLETSLYGYGKDSIESVLGNLLREQHLTLSVAESCTGGYVSHRITGIPGSSDYYRGGIVAYDNKIKTQQLGVQVATLEQYGAVSEHTVIEMAQGIRTAFHTDIGVATSGIAGPSGGSDDKPIGTVWIAFSDKEKTLTKKLNYASDRLNIIKRSSSAVLNQIRIELLTYKKQRKN